MSEFKGTKGDWIAEESYSIEFRQPIFNINVGEIIEGLATVWSGSDKITEESKANAQLIANAPKMLEMLSTLMADFENCGNEIEMADAFSSRMKGIKQLIQQATTIK